jgi:AcrR family transcriptional regulator
MADVAADAGLSAGSVYTYVESKDALFHLVVADGFGMLEPTTNLPVLTPPFGETMQLIGAGLKVRGATPFLKSALVNQSPEDVRGELMAVVTEQYDMVASLSRVLPVIEKCASDLPELDQLYFGRGRRRQIDLLVQYVALRTGAGFFADFSDAAVTAQLIIESVAWFAWKRLEGRDAQRFDDAVCRATVNGFVCRALIGPTP